MKCSEHPFSLCLYRQTHLLELVSPRMVGEVSGEPRDQQDHSEKLEHSHPWSQMDFTGG